MNTVPQWLIITTGVLVLIVGFLFHWVGQLVSVLDWDLATRLGLQEKVMLPDHKTYEHGTALADVLLAWTYGVAAVGLLLGASWGFKLVWLPGAVLLYHGLSVAFWEVNRRRAGHPFFSNLGIAAWCGSNILTGALCLYVGWRGC